MHNESLADTQPSQQTPGPTQPLRTRAAKKRKRRLWVWALLAVLLLFFTTSLGALAGYQSGNKAKQEWETAQGKATIQDQYDLGVQDLNAGRYEVARQRFEYVLTQDPTFPGATEKLAQVIQVLYATATPTPVPPTATPTPTRDLRPIQDLLTQAQAFIANQDWSKAIDTLSALRDEDPNFQVTQVDGMLYLALRNRGIENIMKNNNLEGGSYDLALAERFGPLDVEANQARNLARLYMYGSSFWEAYPQQAVYYFSQVAAAAPYLRDASGWTARERYRSALIQYGDQLAANDEWCKAQDQYELALSIRSDDKLQETVANAALECSPPTETPLPATPTFTATFTPTATATLTPTIVIEPTATQVPALSPTPTPTQEIQPTVTDTPTIAPTTAVSPTETPVQPTETAPPPSETPVLPTETLPPPTETPVQPTDTPPPPTDTPVQPSDTPTTEVAPTEAQSETPAPPGGEPTATDTQPTATQELQATTAVPSSIVTETATATLLPTEPSPTLTGTPTPDESGSVALIVEHSLR